MSFQGVRADVDSMHIVSEECHGTISVTLTKCNITQSEELIDITVS